MSSSWATFSASRSARLRFTFSISAWLGVAPRQTPRVSGSRRLCVPHLALGLSLPLRLLGQLPGVCALHQLLLELLVPDEAVGGGRRRGGESQSEEPSLGGTAARTAASGWGLQTGCCRWCTPRWSRPSWQHAASASWPGVAGGRQTQRQESLPVRTRQAAARAAHQLLRLGTLALDAAAARAGVAAARVVVGAVVPPLLGLRPVLRTRSSGAGHSTRCAVGGRTCHACASACASCGPSP